MDLKTAKAAIGAILDAIPDSELPKFDRIERSADGRLVAWHQSSGSHLGSATRNGIRYPELYRENAISEAIEHEMVYRADKRLLKNGDDPNSLRGRRLV